MTFTSPSTTGIFSRLMSTALLPTSGNTSKRKKRNEVTLHSFNKWISMTWWVCHLLCSSAVQHTHNEKPALSSQLSSPLNHCHHLYPLLGTHKDMKRRVNDKAALLSNCNTLLVWWVLPAMELMRMLLILRALGGGSCLLNVVFIIS